LIESREGVLQIIVFYQGSMGTLGIDESICRRRDYGDAFDKAVGGEECMNVDV
jgi:hypothetical protein